MGKKIYRSPLFYVGDKYKLLQTLLDKFPNKINRFIEPFVGGGSVSLNVSAEAYLLNDINNNVINIHRMLCEYANKEDSFFKQCYQIIDEYSLSCSARNDIIPDNLKREYIKTYYAQYNRESYSILKNKYNESEDKNPLILYILLIYGFNRMLRFNNKGNFNLPVGNVDFNLNTKMALKNYFSIMREKNITWSSLDFREFLDGIQWEEDDYIYLDPPYLITFSEYNKLWNQKTEENLLNKLDELHNRGCKFAISNVTHYKSRINQTFLDWSTAYNVHLVKSNYISFHDNTIKKFNEVLVTNH
ncbi:MAG: Dam family site-specific DNA-(adenine-N6)-methyltransferase [Bacteroidales bacterium]|nr:Dam family site-specific DNA-(adenine-N6)-methyltransferase [Bacteroidales bacterium]